MKTYKVPVTYLSWGLVNVEAESKEDLMNLLKSKSYIDTMPVPVDGEYVDDSYEIDFDSLDTEA